MGISTKTWGPHAWVVYHGLCRALTLQKRSDLKHMAARVLARFQQQAPCIYCRRSMAKFLKMKGTNISRLGKTGGPETYEWAYLMHQRVNWKLFWQDVKTMERDRFWKKWWCYQPAQQNVQYYLPNTPQWWYSFFTFAYYAMCDYEPKREMHLRKLLPEMGELLEVMGYPGGVQLNLVLQDLVLDTSSLESRIEYVYSAHRAMKPMFDTCDLSTAEDVTELCKHAIVGCGMTDKTKVGC